MNTVLWFVVILLLNVLPLASSQGCTGQCGSEACCSGTCKSCLSQNFECTQGSCTGCDVWCMTFTATCGCTACIPGYGFNANGVCTPCGVKNCSGYDVNLGQCYCSACQYPGLTPGPNGGDCIPCQVQHCTDYNIACNCVACDPGWTPFHSGGCQSCFVGNCSSTSYDQYCLCTECIAGFAVSEGSCSPCTMPHCATYTQGPGCVCNSCNAGFTLVDASCQVCGVSHCSTYSEGCTCSECDAGYVVVSQTGTCAEQPCNVVAPQDGNIGNCPTSLPSGSSCSVGCNAGFKLVGTATTCLRGGLTPQSCTGCGVNFCQSYSTGCQCGVCTTGHTLTTTFACDDCGVSHCTDYSTGCQCQTCADPYVVSDGVCIGKPCDDVSTPLNAALGNCPTNSELSSGASCQFICNAGFQFPIDSPVSTSCSLGTVTRQSDCQACAVTECQTYTTGCTCGACYTGYSLSDNNCIESPCAVSPPDHGSLGSCAAIIASQDSCNFACDPGYTVASGPTTCKLGAIQLPKQFCQACSITSCLHYSVSCLCDQCVTGMKASNGFCIACGVDQCVSYKSGCFCGQCDSGYSVTSAGVCAESPCTVTPPDHGSLGNCPNQLPSGLSCSVACNPGYFPTGATSCLKGELTSEQSCAACTVANCVSYSVGCICKKCSFPYKVKTDGTCELQDPFLYQCGQTVFDHSVFGKPADVEPAYLIECPTSLCNGKIWGTDYYTVDSDVCTALRHSTGSTGGYAIMEFDYNTLSHRFKNFGGSSKNGVQSRDYDDSISISFHLTKYTPPPPILVESDSRARFSFPVHTPPLAKVPREAFLELVLTKHASKKSGRPKVIQPL